ncbi:MAG: hypothetical protein ABFD83_06215 [Armatimonadota bacterium]
MRIMKKRLLVLIVIAITQGLFGVGHADITSKRVLLVTTDAGQVPTVYNYANGAYVITDLAGAGYPFDIVTYNKFLTMSLGNHDVIILNGHTSPHPILDVLAKCQAALCEGRKVFLNGDLCNRRFDSSGNQVEYLRYALTLFNVTAGTSGYANGATIVPKEIEKDPEISDPVWQNVSVKDFGFTKQPAMKITIGNKVLGFLYPQGGALDSIRNQALAVIDYGKLVSYLRYGQSGIVGFANDRIDGRPIASFEVHCHSGTNLRAIDELNKLSLDMNMPLVDLLVYNNIAPSGIAEWNTVTNANPLTVCGSHSRSHPQDWPSLGDVLYETTEVIKEQKAIIPETINYLNFSGLMNPSTSQIDQMYQAGLIFGAQGYDQRAATMPSGSNIVTQLMPTCRTWVQNLSASSITPFCLSQTLLADNVVKNYGEDYCQDLKIYYAKNLKFGLYNYGFFHDSEMDPTADSYTNGIHTCEQIRSAMSYLKSQSVKFVRVDDLVLRLRDFVQGWVDYDRQGDGSLNVTVYRPNTKANQVKIQTRDAGIPVASGNSVISQHYCGDFLYVDLASEVQSTFTVSFAPVNPSSISNALAQTDGKSVCVEGIVSAVFSDGCYVEQLDRVRGIKVLGQFRYRTGDKVAFDGILKTVNGERVLEP